MREYGVNSRDVAIIGMSCRAAGDIKNPEQLWQFLMDKKCALGEVPKCRWEPWYRRDPRNARELDKAITKGHFMHDLENFDAVFFGLSPTEAEQMDPQQRLGLELAWEALENAGIDPKKLRGTDTAVFMGVDSDDYARLVLEDIPNIEPYMGIGTSYHGIANRISYHLDLVGPSTAVDAACASSLVAVHLGRQTILDGESRVAIVGGVNIICAPASSIMLHKAGALAVDGICAAFDEDAHGYVRGEGGAVVILKRLEDAISDNDEILAILRGTAVAHNGRTSGIMAPDGAAQERVARQALESTKINPSTIGYVEAHATGTAVGDPVELGFLMRVYGSHRRPNNPVYIGSLKPNVGHLEAAAGIIGLVKSVLSVKKGELAPQAYLKQLTSKVDWVRSGLQVVQEPMKWNQIQSPRRAAICSYGYGGTVANAIIEQFDQHPPASCNIEQKIPVLLVISAPQEKRLPIQAANMARWLVSSGGRREDLSSVAATLALRRSLHDHRVAFVALSHAELAESLDQFAKGRVSQWTTQGRKRKLTGTRGESGAVWVFSGHGAQWEDMGKELLQNSIFVDTIAPLDHIVQDECGYSGIEALKTGNLYGSSGVQTLTYLIQIGLSKVLKSLGARPSAIIGHSVGEVAAAVVAGCLTAEEGLFIVTRRAQLYKQVQGRGRMELINRPFDQIAADLKGRKDIVAAIDTSPQTCVISGDSAPLERYVGVLQENNVKTFKVKTDIAFHSHMLDGLLAPLRQKLDTVLHPREATVSLYSTSNLDPRSQTSRDVQYWVENTTRPVMLRSAVEAAAADGFSSFLEVSSHPIVTPSINEILAEIGIDNSIAIGTLRRDHPVMKSVSYAVAQLHVHGTEIDLKSQFSDQWCRTVPGTPWLHKPYWRKVDTVAALDETQHDVTKHTLTGKRTVIAGTDTILFTTRLNDTTKPYPGSHPLDGIEIVPAGCFINSFLHATGGRTYSDVEMLVPLSMSTETRDVQVIVHGSQLSVASRPVSHMAEFSHIGHDWIIHTTSKWDTLQDVRTAVIELSALKARITTKLPNTFVWDYLSSHGVGGIAYSWQILEHFGDEQEMLVKYTILNSCTSDPYSWAPVLDVATSIGSVIFFKQPGMRIVSGFGQIRLVWRGPILETGWIHVEPVSSDKDLAAHVSILDLTGNIVADLQAMRLVNVETGLHGTTNAANLVYQIGWVPPSLSRKSAPINHVLLVSDGTSVLHDTAIRQLQGQQSQFEVLRTAEDLPCAEYFTNNQNMGSVVVYLPGAIRSSEGIPHATQRYLWEATGIVNWMSSLASSIKLFIVTDEAFKADTETRLAQNTLVGFSRIAAQEQPDLWGALIDAEKGRFPWHAMKYVVGLDIVRIQDGLPLVNRLQNLPSHKRYAAADKRSLLPKPEGTYVVTGGFGGLGLEVLSFLVVQGARRLVVVSRTQQMPRKEWDKLRGSAKEVVERIQELEKLGATIHTLQLDIAADGAGLRLRCELERLQLPPVLGVVHAAGVLEAGFLPDATPGMLDRNLGPKVSGSLALHECFPVGTVDFFIMFSSIGQVVGTPGTSAYGSANAFLDGLARYRRACGDNAIAFQWTVWRGAGMGSRHDFVEMELESKGITDISVQEAFRAWQYVGKFDSDHGVVTRIRTFDEGVKVPISLIETVAPRRAKSSSGSAQNSILKEQDGQPKHGTELKTWLEIGIRRCVAAVLMTEDPSEIEPHNALADLGIDSVMTNPLRQKLQREFEMKVPATLTWNHPTVAHLVEWFYKKMTAEDQVSISEQ